MYSCLCEPGHAWTATGGGVDCVDCADGSFNSLVNSTTCYACDNGGAGSGTTTSCPGLLRVNAGLETVVGTHGVRVCPANHFQDGTSNECTKCPEQSTYTEQEGLTGLSQCACADGYESLPTGVCTACNTLSSSPAAATGRVHSAR